MNMTGFLLCLLSVAGHVVYGSVEVTVPLFMPHFDPMSMLEIPRVCTAVNVNYTNERYITRISPKLRPNAQMHVVLFACDEPAFTPNQTSNGSTVWDCNVSSKPQKGIVKAGRCKHGDPGHMIYEWTINGPDDLVTPEGTGIAVGGSSGVGSIVMSIHYFDRTEFESATPGAPIVDDSGVVLTIVEPKPGQHYLKAAEYYFNVKGGLVPASSMSKVEVACQINQPIVMHPYAARFHTHMSGVVVSAYKVDRSNNWSLIGKADPRLIGKEFPMADMNMTIEEGDTIAVRCTMNRTLPTAGLLSFDHGDEMCQFFLYYYSEGEILDNDFCWSTGPPGYSWQTTLGSVPAEVDNQASLLD